VKAADKMRLRKERGFKMKNFIFLCFASLFSFFHIQMESTQKKTELTLYYSPYCPYSQEVLSYLQKIQKTIPLKNVKKDPGAKEELKRIGGVLEVPCLVINDHALYKSDVIIQWLYEHEDEL
jgi:glutaredoxin